MKYIIEVLTPAFQECVDKWLSEKAKDVAPKGQAKYKESMYRHLKMYWNGDMRLSDSVANGSFQAQLLMFFLPVAMPQSALLCVDDPKDNMQVMWNGELKYLNHIREVIKIHQAPPVMQPSVINPKLAFK